MGHNIDRIGGDQQNRVRRVTQNAGDNLAENRGIAPWEMALLTNPVLRRFKISAVVFGLMRLKLLFIRFMALLMAGNSTRILRFLGKKMRRAPIPRAQKDV